MSSRRPRPTDIRWAGPRAFLVDCHSLDTVLALHAHLSAHPMPGQVDVLAAARTVLAVFDAGTNARSARTTVLSLDLQPAEDRAAVGDPVRIDVVYDGADLAEVGRLTGLGADGVVAAHTGQLWTTAFGGFAPGFAYLIGENTSLDVPRRDTPRTAVPAGAVALAGNFSAVYPRRSPGGWQLIGRTAQRMWDLDREHPALLRPGTKVRYVAVQEQIEVSTEPQVEDCRRRGTSSRQAAGPFLEVLTTGLQSLVQDLGRPGLGDLGVSPSGAADTAAARQANRLVGNPADHAVIENLLGGLAVRAHGELTVALTGAPAAASIRTRRGDRAAPLRAPFALYDGDELHLRQPTVALRTYLAVRGGIAVDRELGSRSTDLLSGLGPAALAPGAVLPVGDVTRGHVVGFPETWTLPTSLLHPGEGRPVVLRITLGPRHDWFTPESQAALTAWTWAVTAESNRIGVRLAPAGSTGSGGSLERARTDELPSEGVVAGALQVPPSGCPVLFLADHPVTGGYPVIGVVVPEDLPVAAQLPPGTTMQFVAVDPATA